MSTATQGVRPDECGRLIQWRRDEIRRAQDRIEALRAEIAELERLDGGSDEIGPRVG